MKTDSSRSTTFLSGMENTAQTQDITSCSFQEILKYQVLSSLSRLNRKAKVTIILLTAILMLVRGHSLLVCLTSNVQWTEQSLIKSSSMENQHFMRALSVQDQVLTILIKYGTDTTCSQVSNKINLSCHLVDRSPEFSTAVSIKRHLENPLMKEVLLHQRESNSKISRWLKTLK